MPGRGTLARRNGRPGPDGVVDDEPAEDVPSSDKAARPALEHVRVMQEPVEQRGDRGGVAEQLPPLVDRPVGGEHRRGSLVAAHDQLKQVLGRGVGQLAHAEVVDDEQVRAAELGEVVLAGLGERRLGEFFEEGVRFAVEDAVALLDGGVSDGLGEVTLPGSGGNRPILPDIKVLKRRSTIRSIRGAGSGWRSCAASSFVAGVCLSFDSPTVLRRTSRPGCASRRRPHSRW